MIRLVTIALSLASFLFHAPEVSAQGRPVRYKCLIQLTNYMGEGAYIVVSLINKDGGYAKTLYVLGSDKRWYPDLKEWHKAQKKKPSNISAVTGASVSGGDRAQVTLTLDEAEVNGAYRIRFESAVEDKGYHTKDVELPLTSEALAAKTEGTGFIRYVRFSPAP